MKSRIVDWAIALQPLQPQVIIRHRSPPLWLPSAFVDVCGPVVP